MDKKEYILFHFNSIYDVPKEIMDDLLLKNPTKISWPEKGEAFYETKRPFELNAIEVEWLETKIPLAFCDKESDVITVKEGKTHLSFDIITASFVLLSGHQEVHQKNLSSRLSVKDTWQYRYKCARKPIVNYYFDILKTALEKAWGVTIPLKRKKTSVFLSHNVVHVNSGWKENAKSELGDYNIGNMTYLMFKRFFGKDIWRTVDTILELEEEYDVRSTFFLMSRKGKHYADYDINEKPYHAWVKDIQGRGFETALLSSNGSQNSVNKLSSDIKKFKYKVYANRFQDQRYNVGLSSKALEKNKMLYDNSLAMIDEVGFRNGYCYPFLTWNFKENRPSKFVSIPLNILDTTLQKRRYLSVVPSDVVNVFKQIAIQSNIFKGVISLNWGNQYFSDFENKEWRKGYEKIIKEAKDCKYSFKTGYQLMVEFRENKIDLIEE